MSPSDLTASIFSNLIATASAIVSLVSVVTILSLNRIKSERALEMHARESAVKVRTRALKMFLKRR